MNRAMYSGILRLMFSNPSKVVELQKGLPEEAVPLSEKDLHVTLIHQSILKPFKKVAKKLSLPVPPNVDLKSEIHRIDRTDRTSWIVLVENQKAMQDYVNSIMVSIGGDPDPEDRVFHVTLANLTGNPFQSVGDVKQRDIT